LAAERCPRFGRQTIFAARNLQGESRSGRLRRRERSTQEGNTSQPSTLRTPSRDGVTAGLERARTTARLNKKGRFTALLHHVNVELLRAAYSWLKRDAAAGVDGVMWDEYGIDLDRRVLCRRIPLAFGVYQKRRVDLTALEVEEAGPQRSGRSSRVPRRERA
jgi:RNA-directed DNA polymerase